MSEKFDDFSSFRSKSMEKKRKKNEAYVDFKKKIIVLHEKHMKRILIIVTQNPFHFLFYQTWQRIRILQVIPTLVYFN